MTAGRSRYVCFGGDWEREVPEYDLCSFTFLSVKYCTTENFDNSLTKPYLKNLSRFSLLAIVTTGRRVGSIALAIVVVSTPV